MKKKTAEEEFLSLVNDLLIKTRIMREWNDIMRIPYKIKDKDKAHAEFIKAKNKFIKKYGSFRYPFKTLKPK